MTTKFNTLEELADILDKAIRDAIDPPLVTPAMLFLLGRYIAYEAGAAERVEEGVKIASNCILASANDAAKHIYAKRN